MDNTAAVQAAGAGSVVLTIIWLVVMLFLYVIPMWKIYSKAGKPGWAILIPIYNIIVLIQVAKRNPAEFLWLIVPIANIIFPILWIVGISKAFGKSGGFAAGMIFLPFIFIPILGYGKATYQA